MTTCSENKLYRELVSAVGKGACFNAAKYAYENGVSYSKLSKLISLGEKMELLLPQGGYDFAVDSSKILPLTIGDVSVEDFADMIDECVSSILEYVLAQPTEPTKDMVLNQAPAFRKSRYESALNLLKSRRVLTELGGRIRANLTQSTYNTVRKVYNV